MASRDHRGRLACLAFLFLLPVPDLAQTEFTALIASAGSRAAISLDGVWSVIVDPYESGLAGRYFENAKPKARSELFEYDFDHSAKLRVPGDWNTQRESLLFYEGPLWYQRYFPYHKRPGVRTFLYFGAANYAARVWLNGAKLGEHVGGFTAFNFEVSEQIVEGENSLVVEVDNTRRGDAVPAGHTDWWNYGGLTRPVRLLEVPEMFVKTYVVQLARGRSDLIEGFVELAGAKAGTAVRVAIPEIGVHQTVVVDGSGRAALRVPARVELWSPEKPRLYRVLIAAGEDNIADEIGFRTIETRGTAILLNGHQVFLRGISLHEEAPFRSGRAFSPEDDGTLLTWARELGCNFVRLAHYPHNEDMVRLADRLGLLVWEEVPVYWDLDWQNPSVLQEAKLELRDMVARDQNRAAIVFWSLSNETPVSAARNDFLRTLAAYARTLDGTRLITSASDKSEAVDSQTMALNDPLGELLDVIGLNEYIGWYGKRRPEDATELRWRFAYSKPVIISEFGGDALYGMHADQETRFSEEYQANLYRRQLEMLSRIPQLAGMSPWLLMDFRSPRRNLPGIQDSYNRKGLISDRGQRKQAFYILQDFYRTKAGEAAGAH
ncbi:MAG: beta galactosidase jelly roll domain-containing protein [Acidobacteria bacterium]|nr:beta galactosidase jelly roll domain-containing protein [Acidobacteriota bacterium]